MRFEGEEDAEIIEGQVTGRSGAPFRPVEEIRAERPIYQVDPRYVAQEQGVAYQQGSGVDLTGLVDAATQPGGRAVALLVKVPLFAYVALHPKLPGLVRLTAGVLGALEALEALQRAPEYEALLPAAPAFPGE
jgi:hypothetical protein